MKTISNGFSLIEFLVVILISGLTIAALFQMLNVGFTQYNYFREENQRKSCMGNIRVWLRNAVCSMSPNEQGFPKITAEEAAKVAGISKDTFINSLNLKKRGDNGYFILVSICYDKNRNGKADSGECDERIMFFRRRT